MTVPEAETTAHPCDLQHLHGEHWFCRTHDVLADQTWPDAYLANPTAEDFTCPMVGEEA